MSNAEALGSTTNHAEHDLLLKRLGSFYKDPTSAEFTASPTGVMRWIRHFTVNKPGIAMHGRHVQLTQVESVQNDRQPGSVFEVILAEAPNKLPDISFYYHALGGSAVTRMGEELPLGSDHYAVWLDITQHLEPCRPLNEE